MHIALLKLWWLLCIPIAVWWLLHYFQRKHTQALTALGTLSVIKNNIQENNKHKKRAQRLFILGLIFLIIALLRPQWGLKQEQLTQKGLDIVLAIDVSRSMNTPDVFPSRLQKTTLMANRILDMLQGDRVALVTFAGSGTILSPLTIDYDAVQLFLTTIGSDNENIPGTSIHAAISKSLEAFEKNTPEDKLIILFTDGEDHEGGLDNLKGIAEDSGAYILPVCVGTQAGQPIPLLDTNGNPAGYKKDKKGNMVVSRIHPENLQPLASNKVYLLDQNSDPTIELLQDIQYYKRVGLKNSLVTMYAERYQFFIVIALLCFLGSILL